MRQHTCAASRIMQAGVGWTSLRSGSARGRSRLNATENWNRPATHIANTTYAMPACAQPGRSHAAASRTDSCRPALAALHPCVASTLPVTPHPS